YYIFIFDRFFHRLFFFVPIWYMEEKSVALGGIYALTSQGQHVFRAFTGDSTVTTNILARDVIGLSTFVDAPTGATVVVAYGRTAVYLSLHHTSTVMLAHGKPFSTTSPISECFVHVCHFVLITHKRIVLVNYFMLAAVLSKKSVAVGMSVDPIELDDKNVITASGALYIEAKRDLLLSIVGTSNGRIYSMMHKKGEMERNSFKNLQALIDSPSTTNQFVFQGALSTPFISSDNEQIVSTVNRKIDGVLEMIVMGIKGSIVRFSYGRERGLTVLEMVTTSIVSPCSLTYRSLMKIEDDIIPLIVAYKMGK
ncbi:hypothetical protein PFISCL1PPCAC_20813, partial [Pristionchus fissidentatus]